MTRIVLLSTAIVTGLIAAGSASAFGWHFGPGDRPGFEQIDADGDGRITPAEMQAYPAAHRAARFRAADADGDGRITAQEMTAAIQVERADREARIVQSMMARLDTDKDGAVSEAEMAAAAPMRNANRGERFLARFDADKDGAISVEEFAAAEQALAQKSERWRHHDKGDRAPFWRR
ncbi:EF-hand domain-containing protein [Tropicimonas sp.]|uniref:EF-hand domain-containing protein n=1 Tax=Tropicimonas sp. TaxID=2067044 RepID=UPI003A8A7066